MFTQKTINRGGILADLIEPKKYGELIHYQEIEQAIGESRGTQRYYSAIAKAKKLLEERGKMIVRIGGGDYQVAYPGDYTEQYAREVRLAGKRIKHGGKILKAAPVKDMTQDEMQTYINVSDFHQRMSASISGANVEIKKLTRNNPLAEALKNAKPANG